MRQSVVGVELHAMVQPLPKVHLQGVVVGVSVICHLEYSLSRSERIRLEEIDGIGTGGRRANLVTSTESGDQGAKVAGVAREGVGKSAGLSLIQVSDELAIGEARGRSGGGKGLRHD